MTISSTLPNPFIPTIDDLDEQISTVRDMLNRSFWRAETAEEFCEIVQIEAEYLMPLLARRAAMQEG